jgi:hypothetical protein
MLGVHFSFAMQAQVSKGRSFHEYLNGDPPGTRELFNRMDTQYRSYSAYTESDLYVLKNSDYRMSVTDYFQLITFVTYKLAVAGSFHRTEHQCFFCGTPICAYKNKEISIEKAGLRMLENPVDLKDHGMFHVPYYFDGIKAHKDLSFHCGRIKVSKGDVLPLCTCCRSHALIDPYEPIHHWSMKRGFISLFQFDKSYLENQIMEYEKRKLIWMHGQCDDSDTESTDPEIDSNQEADEDNQVVLYGSPKDQIEDTRGFSPAEGYSSSEIEALIRGLSR